VDQETKQLRIGLIALAIITLHIAVSLYILVVPFRLQPKHKLVSIYRQLIVLGPFFTESRIKHSHFLSFRYKQNNDWSVTREFTKEQFSGYFKRPWQIDKLTYINYERQLGFAIGAVAANQPFEKVKNNTSFRELNAFLVQEIIKTPVDSIQIVYGLDQFIPGTKSYSLDTVFVYTYNPNLIGKAKK
jgi:hypothetical protein